MKISVNALPMAGLLNGIARVMLFEHFISKRLIHADHIIASCEFVKIRGMISIQYQFVTVGLKRLLYDFS